MCGNVPFCGFSAFGRGKFLTSRAAKKDASEENLG